jgi:hypothetical protein
MPFQSGSDQQVVRISLRCIKRQYGSDDCDNAADDIVYCLRQAANADAPYHFAYSTEHPNPWYHTMDLVVDSLNERTYVRLIELLASYGLSEDA